jgi:hypothetical protein
MAESALRYIDQMYMMGIGQGPAPARVPMDNAGALGGDAQMMQRLRDSSDIERAAYEQFGLEPGLDRANFLPIVGSREQGNLGFGAPAVMYDAAKAFVTPGTAVRGGNVSAQDAMNFAGSVATGGAPMGVAKAMATPDGEVLLGSFGSATKQYSALRKLAPYLTDEEKALFENPQWRKQAENTIGIHQSLPSVREMANVALAGGAKKGWYEDSYNAIQEIFRSAEFPDDPERFTALLAALSPQTSVESNLRNALGTWKNWLAAGRPTDQNQILKIMGESVEGDKGVDSVLGAWRNNSFRALTAPDAREMMGPVGLSGPKVQSFFRNLAGDFDEVTNDAWMAKLSSINQSVFGGVNRASFVDDIGNIGVKGPGYLAQNAKQRQAAERLGWTPAQVQETSWSFGKTLSDLAGQPNFVIRSMEGAGIQVPEMYRGLPVQTAESALRGGYLTDEAIGGTPAFNDLLLTPGYRELLTGAGYASPARSTSTREFTSPYDRINVGPADLSRTTEGRDLIMASRRLDKMQRRADAYSTIDTAAALGGMATTATEKRSAAQRLAQASRILQRSASELPNVTIDTPYRLYLNK